MQKIEYLENKKSFLDEMKSVSHNYLRSIIWWKNEKERRQVLNSIVIKVLCNGMICSATMNS